MRRASTAVGVCALGMLGLGLLPGCGSEAPVASKTVRPIVAVPDEAPEQDAVAEAAAALAADEPEEETGAGGEAAANRPPRVAGLQVRPAEWIRGPQVVARAQVDDPDGDDVTVEYTWLVNGDEVDASGPVFSTLGLERGDEVQVRVVASDGNWESEPLLGPKLKVDNGAPAIVSQPSGPGPDGVFHYHVRAEDPEGDRALRYRLAQGPPGMTISAVTGDLEWRPAPGQAGVHPVEIVVEDSAGASSRQSFELTVEPPPAAPAP